MNQILLILDGILAKYFLERLCLQKTSDYHFDVVYYNEDSIDLKLENEYIKFIKFDPSSASKLKELFLKNSYTQVFIHMKEEFDVKAVYDNIRQIDEEVNIVLVDFWGLSINDDKCDLVDVRSSLSEYLLSFLPDVPNLAHNIGLSIGEIMEVKVPAYSIFAYRHISSISQKKYKIALIYRNKRILIPSQSTMIIPNDSLLLVGEPSVLQGVYHNIKGGTGQFPSPFGNNLYLFLDMALCSENELLKAYNAALLMQSKTSSKRLFIHVINVKLSKLYDELKSNSKAFITVYFDYKNTSTKNIKSMLMNDDLGLIIIDDKNIKKRKHPQAWAMVLYGISAGINAGTAGYSTSYSTSYSPNQANVASTNQILTLGQMMDNDQTIRERGYLKTTTIYPNEAIIGYMNIKRKKGKILIVNIPTGDYVYTFKWNVNRKK